MGEFLDIYDLLKLSQYEENNLNRPITSTEREAELKISQLNKSSRPHTFSIEFYQTFKMSWTLNSTSWQQWS